MEDDQSKKWDWKQIGTGAGGSVLALFLLQDRGIELMTKQQETSNQVIIEKTIANAHRINSLESAVQNINQKIDAGFNDIRRQMKSDVDSIKRDIKSTMEDRWTKIDHIHYARDVNDRFEKIELELKELSKKGR